MIPPPANMILLVLTSSSSCCHECTSIHKQASGGEGTQSDGQRLASSYGSGDTAASEDEGRKQGKLDAIWLLVLNSVASIAVLHM